MTDPKAPEPQPQMPAPWGDIPVPNEQELLDLIFNSDD